MKHLVLLIISILIGTQLEAQTISKQVIGSAGYELSNDSYTINFTIGETVVGTIDNGSKIQQGFWAELSNDETLTVETLVDEGEKISVFPNPTVNLIQIKYKQLLARNYKTQLYDANGREILKLNPHHNGDTTQISLEHLSSGIYLLVISNQSTHYNKSIKIIKK